jgi:hypothetical protein
MTQQCEWGVPFKLFRAVIEAAREIFYIEKNKCRSLSLRQAMLRYSMQFLQETRRHERIRFIRIKVRLDKYGNPVKKKAMHISVANEMMILTSGHWWWWRYSLGGVLPPTS